MVTRLDLPVAAQACQATHAALAFALAHPDVAASWHRSSNVIVLLGVPDESRLNWPIADAACLSSSADERR